MLDISQAQIWEIVPAGVGAVLGATAAAFPAYWLARKASQEILQRDKEQRLLDARAKSYRAMTVLVIIANSVFTLRGMIEEMLLRDVPEGEKTPNQRKVSAVVGFSFESMERFESDDLAILSSLSDAGLPTDMMHFASSHGAIIWALIDYKSLKLKNHDLLSDGAEHVIYGEVVHTIIRDRALAAKIRINDAQLESMITQIIPTIREESHRAISIGRRFNSVMADTFDKGKRPSVNFDQAVERFPDIAIP